MLDKKKIGKRTKTVHVKMNDDEYAILEFLSNYYGISKSKVLRELIKKDYESFFTD